MIKKAVVRGLYLSVLVLLAPAGLAVGQWINGPASLWLH